FGVFIDLLNKGLLVHRGGGRNAKGARETSQCLKAGRALSRVGFKHIQRIICVREVLRLCHHLRESGLISREYLTVRLHFIRLLLRRFGGNYRWASSRSLRRWIA